MHYFCRVLNLIYPSTCGICGKINANGLCKKCEIKLNLELETKIEDYRNDSDTYFIEHVYLSKYVGIIREKIIQYKFKQYSYLYKLFSELFLKNQKICVLLEKYDIILPVPIHKKRKSKRGYNQSELIAKEIAINKKNIILDTTSLIKKQNNKPQSTLDKVQRQQNTYGVYCLKDGKKLKEKNILLFDDVYTTGSTVNECARILIEQGNAKSVGVLTIAKD